MTRRLPDAPADACGEVDIGKRSRKRSGRATPMAARSRRLTLTCVRGATSRGNTALFARFLRVSPTVGHSGPPCRNHRSSRCPCTSGSRLGQTIFRVVYVRIVLGRNGSGSESRRPRPRGTGVIEPVVVNLFATGFGVSPKGPQRSGGPARRVDVAGVCPAQTPRPYGVFRTVSAANTPNKPAIRKRLAAAAQSGRSRPPASPSQPSTMGPTT